MTQKLDIGGVLRRVFQTYSSQFGVLFPAALIVFVAIGIIAGLLLWLGGSIGGLIGFLVGVVLAGVVAFVGIYLFQGMVVQLVRDVQDGRRDFSMGQLFESASPAVPRLIGAGLLIALAIYIPTFLVGLVSRPLSNLVQLLLSLFLLTIWAVVSPVIVVERSGVIPSLGRSRELVRGNGWQVLAVIVVLYLILFIGVWLLVLIAGGISRSIVGVTIGAVIAFILAAPVLALGAATIYFQLLQLKEGAGVAPAAVGPAPGGVGTGEGVPAEPAAPPQAPPPGTADTTPEGPPPPPPPAAGQSAAGSTEPAGPEIRPRPPTA
jgi:hypothetical protein